MLSVREMQQSDVELIAAYWLNADEISLRNMGADINKIPSAKELKDTLNLQLQTSIENRRSFCMIWLENEKPVGHCNTNPTKYGDHAFMHLHLWDAETRKKGMGYELVKMTLPHFFKKLKLKKLYCEPYALNPAPNNTLKKIGFKFVKEYITTPGSLNFEQPVKLWEMKAENILN